MVNYIAAPSDTEVEGCLIALELWLDHEGELTRDQLEDIDEEMKNIGSQRTGQRINIESAGKSRAKIRYVYQERLMATSLEVVKERLQPPFGDYDDPTIFIGTEVVNLRGREYG